MYPVVSSVPLASSCIVKISWVSHDCDCGNNDACQDVMMVKELHYGTV
jgi:hypothetical protein